jgi:hypothetical protein
MVCGACGATLDLPPSPQGQVPWLPLVERLRDSPDNRDTWTPTEVTAPCPACGGPATFPVNTVTMVCDGCGTPLVRGATAGDAPLPPGGVIPFTVGEANAEELLRQWAASRGRLGNHRVDVSEVRREYVPYWEFSAHVHCPYRGEYEYRNRDGEVQRRAYDGTIDKSFVAFGRGFSHLPTALLRKLEPVSCEAARPYDPRYLAGAIVQQDTRGLWGAWDMARGKIDARVDAKLKAAGDGATLPGETWPTWSQHKGRLVLVPLHVLTCTALGETWPALVHGVDGEVVAVPPLTPQNKAKAYLASALALVKLIAVAALAALALWWLVQQLFDLLF